MTTTAELIALCRADLTRIADMIPWAHTDAYNPTNAPTERPIHVPAEGCDIPGNNNSADVTPQPAPLSDAWLRCPHCRGRNVSVADVGRLFTAGDYVIRSTCRAEECGHTWTSRDRRDQVAGPRLDLAVGSHTSRHAYTTAIAHINAAELAVGTAWWLTTQRRPRLQKPLATSNVGTVLKAVDHTRTRLADLDPYGPMTTKTLIGNAARHLDHAWTALNGAFTIGAADPTTHARSKTDTCRICGIRDRADGCGGRCHTCKTYRTRRGHERPTELDSIDDARQAQERRLARGEGYGEA